jgi:hypothetical protein
MADDGLYRCANAASASWTRTGHERDPQAAKAQAALDPTLAPGNPNRFVAEEDEVTPLGKVRFIGELAPTPLNRDALLAHWRGDIDGIEIGLQSRPVP